MGIDLIITKSFDRDYNETDEIISLEEWLTFVEQEQDLRLITEQRQEMVNPVTKEVLSWNTPKGASEIIIDNEWIPFLYYRGGELLRSFDSELDEPDSLISQKISQVANKFNALITTDADDEFLDFG